MKKPITLLTAICAMLAFLQACISDSDIPYPNIQANIIEFQVEGQTRPALIDTLARTVTVALNDSVNPACLRVDRFVLAPGASLVTDTAVITRGIDLSKPLTLTLKVYREYQWTVTATQTIERIFAVAGQVGPAVIDTEKRTASLAIPTSADITAVTVTALKLGGANASYSPDIVGKATDFSHPVTVDVTEYGTTTQWTLTVTQTDLAADLTSVDPWTCVAWLHAAVKEGAQCRFEYRKAEPGNDTWIAAPGSWVTDTARGELVCRLIHLDPDTRYEARVVDTAADTPSGVIPFTTGSRWQAPNSTFSQWWLDGKVWCPWASDGEPFWGTGNKGATTLGDSNTTPLRDTSSPTGFLGASLETRFVGIGMLGKLASGNLFSGTYIRTDGTNGILSFGRPCSQRPTSLRATVKYSPVPISHSSNDFTHLKGQPDTCVVWCALIDSDEPYEIRTKPSDRHLFDEHAPEVIAYGRFQQGSEIADFTTVDIPLEYVSTARVPKYILIVASASKYGDYFTGGAGSLLLIRDYELQYDYDE